MALRDMNESSGPLSLPDSSGRGSDNFMMRVANQIVKGDRGKHKALQPPSGNISDGQSEESEDAGGYYLPRSSPVMSRRQEKKTKKPPSADANNKAFHERTEEELRQGKECSCAVSKILQDIFPEEQTASGSLLDTRCSPAAGKGEKCQNVTDEQRNLPFGSSASQASSYEESDLLNAGAPQVEKGAETCLSKCLISGAGHEEQLFCEAFYRRSADLDQENAHFVVVDMVLEVLEVAKWAMSQKHSDSFSSTDSGYEELSDHRISSNRSLQTLDGRCSAQILAQNLLMEMERWWISSEELLGEIPLVTVSMAPGGEAGLSDEIRQKSRMRGTLMWTPPQFQIISSVHPTQRRSDVIAFQQFLCAGCGTEIEPRYMKRLRYCDYLGKYFCNGCHGGGEAIIPARVLNHWDFGRYPVCQFSKQLLESIWEKPLFKITDVAKNLYSQAKELQKFREIQEQLISIKRLLIACRLSEGILVEFQQVPSHLSKEHHLFAMDDLVKIKRGQLLTTSKAVMRSATSHVQDCELCQARGFICEFCHGKDVLFPFQTDICTRCQECRACFHTSCFRETCPKCIRIQTRRAARR